MVRWIYKIIISDITAPYRDRDVTDEEAKEVGKKVAKRIRQSEAYKDRCFEVELGEIARKFEEEVYDQKDFNSILAKLYDYGDVFHIWIDNLPISIT